MCCVLVESSGKDDQQAVVNNKMNQQAAHEDTTTAAAVTAPVNELRHSTSDIQQLKVITTITLLNTTVMICYGI